MQKLGVTEIEIDYHSPAHRNRDVWNNQSVIPQNGNPFPWRAGANMNTTISFSTDVMIEGQSLKAGKYGFHIIPNGNSFDLLFAHNNDLWGSYYLDVDKDVTLRVNVTGVDTENQERLTYRFLDRKEDSLIIGLEWADKRIPFTVSVDLNETVVASLRSELRGLNTYRWQAWNDAANWCLQHNTNLEEALQWVERSISGGVNGFGANKNLTNLMTKANIQKKLGLAEALDSTISEAMNTIGTPADVNYFGIFLMRDQEFQKAQVLTQKGLDQNPETWYLQLNHGICSYFLGKKKQAIAMLNRAKENTPEAYKSYVDRVLNEVRNGTYKL
ncbi:hypothetical protein BFP97_04690 [Roseivirga sp. 4D4]|nr:hypothetical protein BFP97_04690 [Roseivirga sp. 4D4]